MNGVHELPDRCPEWHALAEARDDGGHGERLWREALQHRRGCESCRRASLAVDPTLLFRELRPVELDSEEIEQMLERVHVSRRFVEASERSRGPNGSQQRADVGRWLAAAAAAAVLALAAWAGPRAFEGPSPESSSVVAEAGVGAPSSDPTVIDPTRSGRELSSDLGPATDVASGRVATRLEQSSARVLTEHLASLPRVEDADVRYQLASESADFAVVVHAGLDL